MEKTHNNVNKQQTVGARPNEQELNQNTIGEERKEKEEFKIERRMVTKEENTELPLEKTRANNNSTKKKKLNSQSMQ